MNDQSNQLRRQLEAATAPDGGPEEVLDPETAALREGWLALGRLLGAAEASLGEPSHPWPMRDARNRRRWRLAAVLVSAASLLVALAVAWALHGLRPAGTPAPAPDQMASQSQAPGKVEPSRREVSPEEQTASAETELRWDDPLDEQIVSAGQAVIGLREQWSSQSGGLDYLRYGLNQVEEEFKDGTL